MRVRSPFLKGVSTVKVQDDASSSFATRLFLFFNFIKAGMVLVGTDSLPYGFTWRTSLSETKVNSDHTHSCHRKPSSFVESRRKKVIFLASRVAEDNVVRRGLDLGDTVTQLTLHFSFCLKATRLNFKPRPCA
jgi:hypothetical protein